ncbi:MAG: hypothetical protein Q9221_007767 [Calogaya cf. arnoldii]
MANLSLDDRVTIAKHPLDTFLDHIREPLRKTEQSYEPGSLSFGSATDSSDHDPQEAISKLLLALMGHKVAYNLRSKTENSNIATALSKLFGFVQSGRFNYEYYRALSRLVVKQASDIDIWNAVFDLIITVSRTTPPTSVPVSFDGTPITSSSASQQGAKRQIDLFVKPNNKKLSKVVHDWKDVEVIGELKESNKDKKATLLQIGRYVRDVFSCQPTRRYVHAFTLCGNEMRSWVFDRSGPYSSTAFDIHGEPECFIRTIAAYVMMSDDELGLDTFIQRDDGDQFITVVEDATGKERRLQLEPDPIASQRAIVCRGTSCFRARTPSSEDLRYVVKFSWVSDKRRPEADLLRLARERGVKGVAKLFGHHRITSIADMREGLTFRKPYAFRNTTLSPASSFSQSQSLLSQSFSQRFGLGTAGEPPKKRKSVDAGGSPSKKSRSNSQSPDKAKRDMEENSQTTSLYTHDDSSFDNRIFGCLVISPGGRAIRDFGSIPELLKALRDAIKAHMSLYTKGKILHRDISENNIIITDPKEADGFTGMLIDEDLAKEIGSGRSGARHQTGTMEFMAIQVLQRVAHTYRHDLESFLYVLLWMCARRAWEREFECKLVDRPKRNILTKWYTGSFDDIAEAKRGYMHIDGFEDVLHEFPPAFDRIKPLCKKIRSILFPLLEDGALFTGTRPDPPEKLYDPIIEAFEDAIQDSKK